MCKEAAQNEKFKEGQLFEPLNITSAEEMKMNGRCDQFEEKVKWSVGETDELPKR